nr:hypothetical protein HK105_000501 [Polyrhizophydium stewartii]
MLAGSRRPLKPTAASAAARAALGGNRLRETSLVSRGPSHALPNAAAPAPARAASATPTKAGEPPANADDVRRSFEEWMKIAADNNISPANTWNLALIDYFHEMSVLRDGNSINFQKASCTLDGCVKIYTSRVDSVDSETKRLLDSLAERSANRGGAGEGDEGDEESTGRTARIRVSKSSAKTIEEDSLELNWKQLESEFSVDPLFKKTAAEFDEGGAQGLLLNHLAIATSGKVLFDAGDVMLGDIVSGVDAAAGTASTDISFADLDQLRFKLGDKLANLSRYSVCPSFESFRFDGSAAFNPDLASTMMNLTQSNYAAPTSFEEDPLDQGPLVGGDADYGDVYGDDDLDDNIAQSFIADAAVGQLQLDDLSMVSAPDESIDASGISKTVDPSFAYFDSTLMRNWAGPEYWRTRPLRAAKKPDVFKLSAESGPLKKPTRIVPKLDFISGESVDINVLLAPTAKPNLLPKTTTKALPNNLLPPDLHISSTNFLQFFLKPDFRLQLGRRHDGNSSSEPSLHLDLADKVLTSTPIASAAAPAQEPEGENYYDYDNFEYDFDDGGDAMGGVGGPALDGAADAISHAARLSLGEYGDHLAKQAAEVQRQAVPPPLTFARTAKRVDVKRLKENIWHLIEHRPEKQNPLEMQPAARAPQREVFSSLVSDLAEVYPQQSFKDLSVAFCFICVLHLANEQNLAIDGSPMLEDMSIRFA